MEERNLSLRASHKKKPRCDIQSRDRQEIIKLPWPLTMDSSSYTEGVSNIAIL